MKITQLKIKNIGIIAEETIQLNKPLILFYGEIRAGKTTILNAVRWVCGGAFPSDIIRHGEKDASIELGFDGGSISRSFYKSKEGATKAREVVFVRGGKPVAKPVSEIQRFLNPFLLDQDFLRNKSELERKQYFTELFAVDTTELDTALFNNERDARDLRSTIKGYGDINLTPVEAFDIEAARKELSQIKSIYQKACDDVFEHNRVAMQHNGLIEHSEATRQSIVDNIADLETELKCEKARLAETDKWLNDNPAKKTVEPPSAPDTAELETKISNGAAQNVRAEQYQSNKKRAGDKAADEKKLSELEARGRDIKKQKTAKLKDISESCKIKGLAFDEAGNFTYEGTEAGMLSTSQVMKLSSELSALYPEGFGLDLIDRGESLGKSIFDFVERAKREDKTILATIVGERPAKTPPEVGVFVVENGKVKP